MPAADLAPLQSQQASQHTRTSEGCSRCSRSRRCMIARSADDMPQDSGYPPRKASFGTLAPALPQPLWSSPDGCSHANGPVRAYTSLGAVVPHHFDDVVETAGLALHDEESERISRLFDETIADFSIGIGRPRGMRQVPSARPQAAPQAAQALTPSPGCVPSRRFRTCCDACATLDFGSLLLPRPRRMKSTSTSTSLASPTW
jgi:hypothetical protein